MTRALGLAIALMILPRIATATPIQKFARAAVKVELKPVVATWLKTNKLKGTLSLSGWNFQSIDQTSRGLISGRVTIRYHRKVVASGTFDQPWDGRPIVQPTINLSPR